MSKPDGKHVVFSRPADGIWNLALVHIDNDVTHIEIAADTAQTWQYGENGERCGPGGIRKRGTDCLCPWAPVGAIVGKLGGSNADDTSVPDAALLAAISIPTMTYPTVAQLIVFPVGGRCVLKIPKDFNGGPLFLSMNDSLSRFGFHDGQMNVNVTQRRSHGKSLDPSE